MKSEGVRERGSEGVRERGSEGAMRSDEGSLHWIDNISHDAQGRLGSKKITGDYELITKSQKSIKIH